MPFCVLSFGTNVAAQGLAEGLQVADPGKIRVLIEDLPSGAQRLGLSQQQVGARVSSNLRKAGIKPVDEAITPEIVLYVQISVVENTVCVDVAVMRPVTFQVGDSIMSTLGTTWRKGVSGRANTADYILQAVDRQVDVFCNEFLKANHK